MRLLAILIVAIFCTACTNRSAQLANERENRVKAQEDAVDAILLAHYQPLRDGSSVKEIRNGLKHRGLDYIVGKSTSEFPELFDAAYTPDEMKELFPEWEPRRQIRDWTQDKGSYVFLDANIWKHIGMLENASKGTRPDTLVITMAGDSITGYKFFANLLY